MPSVPSYKDFSLTFKAHPITDDLQVVKDDNAIKQSIRALLLTVKGERLFNNDIGTRLRELLFEPLDVGSASQIKREIATVLDDYEPRIIVNQILVEPNIQENGYDVELNYGIIGRESRVTTELFLDRLI
jgi:uncharacterized protein